MDLNSILLADDVITSIQDNMDLLLSNIPEIKNMLGFKHNHPHHHLDVWNHTLLALSISEKDFDVRLSLLLHDIGKPFSCQEDGEIRHFKDHAEVSSKMAKMILRRSGYPEDYNDYICFLIKYHDTPISDTLITSNLELSSKLYSIQRSDALAHHPDKLEKRKAYLKAINEKISIKEEQNNTELNRTLEKNL